MKSGFDVLTAVGIVLALVAILGGVVAKGSSLAALYNGAAIIIVLVGTLAAALIQARMAVFMHSMKQLPWILSAPAQDGEAMVEKVIEWSQTARKGGLLGLEPLVAKETDELVVKGLQLLVDGTDAEVIRSILEVDVSNREEFDIQGAKVYESMGIYAPTLGIIGAVMGLMAVMQNLSEPEKLGPGIAAAFTATIYGIGLANLFFLPVANKLKSIIHGQAKFREMVIEGIAAIAEGENPRKLEAKLRGFLH